MMLKCRRVDPRDLQSSRIERDIKFAMMIVMLAKSSWTNVAVLIAMDKRQLLTFKEKL